MIYLLLFPLLVLITPRNYKNMALFIIIYLLICTLFQFDLKRYKIKIKMTPQLSVGKLIASLLLNVVFGILFFNTWKSSNIVNYLADLLSVDSNALLIVISVLLALLSTLCTFILLSNDSTIKEFYNLPIKGEILRLFQPCKNPSRTLIFSFLAVVCIVLLQSGMMAWGTADDYWISCVLNGIYSANDNYCSFVNPILAIIVKIIDKIFPYADGLGLFSELMVFVGLWGAIFIIFETFSLKNSFIVLLYIAALNYEINLFHLPFTSLTGLFAVFGALFLYYYLLQSQERAGFCILGTVFVFCACIWRFEAFLLMLPYILLVFATDFLSTEETQKKYHIIRGLHSIVPSLLLCIICVGIKSAVDSSDYYEPGIEFNSARSAVVDYPQKPYSECADQLESIGVSENDFDCVKNLIIADTDIITTEYLKAVSEITKEDIKGKLEGFDFSSIFHFFSMDNIFDMQILLIVLLILVVMFSNASIFHKIELLCALLGTYTIWICLEINGHMMTYIIQTLLFGVWFTLLSVFLTAKISFQRHGQMISCVTIVLAVFLFGSYYKNPDFRKESIIFAKDSEITDVVNIDSDESTAYIWCVYNYDEIVPTFFSGERKLLSEEFASRNIVDGEWHYNQPYYIDCLSKMNLDNPMKSLIYRDHTYYVGNETRCKNILTFLQEHYGNGISVKCVGNVRNLSVWKFSL